MELGKTESKDVSQNLWWNHGKNVVCLYDEGMEASLVVGKSAVEKSVGFGRERNDPSRRSVIAFHIPGQLPGCDLSLYSWSEDSHLALDGF